MTLYRTIPVVPLMGVVWLTYTTLTAASLWSAAFAVALALSFLWGRSLSYPSFVWIIFILFMTVNVAVAFTQVMGFDFVPYIVHPGGLFGNANYLGCALTLAVAAALAYEVYLFVPIGLLGLLISQSRGAIAATGVVLLIHFWRIHKATAISLVLAATVLVLIASDERMGSFHTRLGIWKDTLDHLTIWGSGFGSFESAYQAFSIRTNMTELRATHVYNDYLELVFELGLGSIPLWIMLLACMEGTDERPKLICYSFLLCGLTFFPLSVPGLGLLAAFAFGNLLRSRNIIISQPYGESNGTMASNFPTLLKDRTQRGV